MERRKHKRFPATAFLNRPVTVTPLPPFIGKPAKGKLIDLSAGGLAMLINQIIPQNTRLTLTLTFPDQMAMQTETEVKHVIPRDKLFLHGLEFLALDPTWADRIARMSADYVDCEQRISSNSLTPCTGSECSLFNMCSKPERTNLIVNLDEDLLLAFRLPEPAQKP